jgi:hypothetical protein
MRVCVEMIDWKDAAQVRAYKTGWQSGARVRNYFPRPGMSELAYRCMLNEIGRARKSPAKAKRKPPQNEGNQAWKQLSTEDRKFV